MTKQLDNYQDSGAAKTAKEANEAIAAARRSTPENVRSMFRSSIRFVHGMYEWFWILK